MNEIWKDVYFIENGVEYDYRGLYQVSNLGNIKSLGNDKKRKEKILKAKKTKDGYLSLNLWKNGKQKMFYIHRLVAYMFIKNDDPLNKTQVNHIDENKENNNVENLEWCTREYNNNYGTRNERAAKAQRAAKSIRKVQGKKVIGYSLTSTKVIVLQSTRQAEKFGFNQGAIWNCCNGKRKSHKGFIWKYHKNK